VGQEEIFLAKPEPIYNVSPYGSIDHPLGRIASKDGG
jgi:hypothetical protein